MLKAVGSIKVTDFYMVIDDYVPFTFRCKETASVQPLYWRIGNFKDSLIEIGINQNSGAVCALTITCFIKPIATLQEDDFELVAENTYEGVPICDIRNWPSDRFWDDLIEFKAIFEKDKLYILINSPTDIRHSYRVGNLVFGFDSGANLSWLEINNLSSVDIWKMTGSGQ